MVKDRLAEHRRRQGLIMALLLLGPMPIALELFVLGDSPGVIGLILAETAALILAMLELYRRQRKLAPKAGLPVLSGGQVGALLVILGCIAGGTFLLPSTETAPIGFACLVLAAVLIYGMGVRLARTQKDPDERSAILVLALMAVMIAFGGAFV